MIGTDSEQQRDAGSADRAGEAPPAPTSTGTPAADRQAAAERWVREHGDMLWRFCKARTGSDDAAEELVQETLFAAMQAMDRFDGLASERTWLIGIAAHKVSDYFRRMYRDRGLTGGQRSHRAEADEACGCTQCASLFSDQGQWARVPAAWADAENPVEQAARAAALRECLSALPVAQSEAVWLREILGLPGEEVCKALKLTPTNLWTRLHRARSALRTCLEGKLVVDKPKEKRP